MEHINPQNKMLVNLGMSKIWVPSQPGGSYVSAQTLEKKISHEGALINPEVIKTSGGHGVRPQGIRLWGCQDRASPPCVPAAATGGSSGLTRRNGEAPGVTFIRRKHRSIKLTTQGGHFGGKEEGFEGWKGSFMGKKGGGKGDLWIFPCSRNKRQLWEKHWLFPLRAFISQL